MFPVSEEHLCSVIVQNASVLKVIGNKFLGLVFFAYFNKSFSYFSESSKEQFASTNIAEELVKLFKKQIEHDKREMIFEVLAPLAENGKEKNTFWCLLMLGFSDFFKAISNPGPFFVLLMLL